MTPDKLIRLCESLIEEGNKEEARKVAYGISIITGQPAWQKAYDFLIDEKNPDEFISTTDIEIPNYIAKLLNSLHDLEGKEFKNQSAKNGTQVDLTNHPIAPIWINNLGDNFMGIWTTRLQKGGFHVNHIHPRGEQSHVCYIDIPDNTSGHLTFGSTRFSKKPPLKTIVPEMGMLVSFPCWLWHGVSPYLGDKPRLTIAFDTRN